MSQTSRAVPQRGGPAGAAAGRAAGRAAERQVEATKADALATLDSSRGHEGEVAAVGEHQWRLQCYRSRVWFCERCGTRVSAPEAPSSRTPPCPGRPGSRRGEDVSPMLHERG